MCRAWSLNYVNFTMHKSYVVCLHTPAESRWERDKNVASLLFLQTFQCFQNSPDLLSYFRVNKCSVEKGMRNPNALENQTGSFQYKLQRIMLAVPVYFFKFKIFLIFLPEKKKKQFHWKEDGQISSKCFFCPHSPHQAVVVHVFLFTNTHCRTAWTNRPRRSG